MLKAFARPPWVVVVVFTLALSHTPTAQDLLKSALSDLARYVDAAVSFVTRSIASLDNLDPKTVARDKRDAAKQELTELSRSIRGLRMGQAVLIDDLSDYAATVRKRGFASVDDVQDWSTILSSVRRVSDIVEDTLKLVDKSNWLAVVLPAEERLALAEVLTARVSLLSRFRDLPAPTSSFEIDQLDRMNSRYRELFASLGALNVALLKAADKLGTD